MVPIQDTVMFRYSMKPIGHHLHYFVKLSIKKHFIRSKSTLFTYPLPIFTCRGLMSLLLKAANKSSHGAASYECGPVKRRGKFRLSKTFRILGQV